MAGAIKVQTRPGRGRSRESWYGGGTQAASMSAQHADALELAGQRQPRGGLMATLHKSNPGEPGVTGKVWSPLRGSGTATAPTPAHPKNRAAGQPGSSSRRRGGGTTKLGGPRQTVHPAQPGVTARKAGRKNTNTGKNPGENHLGDARTARHPINNGPEQALVHALVPLAQRLGAKMTTRHLQNAAASATGRDYRAGVTHLSRAHETARAESGNVSLMNAIQKASGMIRQATNS